MLVEFGPALRKAKSLLELHLSGNPGIDTENILANQLFNRAHCQPYFKRIVIDEIHKDNIAKNLDGFVVKNQLKEGLKGRAAKAHTQNTEEGRINKINDSDRQKLIFDRILGHKLDIPGSGQWRMLTRPS